LNTQNSLKLLEYIASDLKIITNETPFIKNFIRKNKCKFLMDENVSCLEDIKKFKFKNCDIRHLTWNYIFKKIDLKKIIINL